jgi:hypothetical protein
MLCSKENTVLSNDLDIKSLSGTDLERFVSSLFQSQGYYVERNLRWPEPRIANVQQSVDILEADILARYFSPFWESRILIECKGGCTFNDLFKFIGICNVVRPDAAFLICSNSANFDEIEKVGKENRIIVIRPEDIMSKFGSSLQVQMIKKWYCVNQIEDTYLDRDRLSKYLGYPNAKFSQLENQAFSEIKKYNSLIRGEYWKTSDPRKQALLLNELFQDQKDFIRSIGRAQEIKFQNSELAITNNIFCESAASVLLRAKISYLISALRCAIYSLISTEENYLNEIKDENFKAVVVKMTESIHIACRLPSFIQFWVYNWGGILYTANNEIELLSKQYGERTETIQGFISLLDEIFRIITSVGIFDWGMHKAPGYTQFKAIPDAIRGIGMVTRKETPGIDMKPYPYAIQWEQKYNKIINTI